MSSLSEEDCQRLLDPKREQEFRKTLGDEHFETQRSRAHMTLLALAQQKVDVVHFPNTKRYVYEPPPMPCCSYEGVEIAWSDNTDFNDWGEPEPDIMSAIRDIARSG